MLWACRAGGDYLGTLLAGAKGWRLNSAGHFAERHGLIVIVALGESIVSIGVGVPRPAHLLADRGGLRYSGLTVAAALWWAYFDVTSLLAERALAASRGHAPGALAQAAYTFLHLPMVVGVIVVALGLKKVLGVRRRAGRPHPRRPPARRAAGRAVRGAADLPARARVVRSATSPAGSTSSAWCSGWRWSRSPR